MEQRRFDTLNAGPPKWWHHHGCKISVKEFTLAHLILANKAATLTITKYNEKYWRAAWHITRMRDVEWCSGQVLMTSPELQAAFGLSNSTGSFGDWLLAEYGATAASHGTFIRDRSYLNIPCPGTGHDGDPNISIELNDGIVHIVHRFMREARLAGDRVAHPCLECTLESDWVQHRKRESDRHYCQQHAKEHTDFGQNGGDIFSWEKMEPKQTNE